MINLSPWLKPRKEEYKNRLREISASGDYDPWVCFLATAVEAQAEDMVTRIEQLLTVRLELLGIVRENRIRGFAVDVVKDLIGYSSLTPSTTAKRHNVQYKTANDAFKRLAAGQEDEAGKRTGSGTRSRRGRGRVSIMEPFSVRVETRAPRDARDVLPDDAAEAFAQRKRQPGRPPKAVTAAG